VLVYEVKHSLTSYLNGLSIARLFHGSLPAAAANFITTSAASDDGSIISSTAAVSSAAADITQRVHSFAQGVHSSISKSSSDKGDYPDLLNNFYISKYASLVESVSNQIANINSLDPAVDDQNEVVDDQNEVVDDQNERNEQDADAQVQITDKGGMVLDILTYGINFIKTQTEK
jgi:hypothetical protein